MIRDWKLLREALELMPDDALAALCRLKGK